MATWQKLYAKGDFVQVLHGNEWILGYVINRRQGSTPEYDVQLMTDGSVVTHTFKTVRDGKLDMGDDDDFDNIELPAAAPPPEPPKRFGNIEPNKLNDMEMAAKACNTHKQTAWGIKIFKDWLLESGEEVEFEKNSKAAFAALLKTFYAEVRTHDGKEYAKKSLLCVRASVQRYISQPPFNVMYNIISDPVFSSANNVLAGHIKQNKAAGLDESNSYPPITEADKLKMYSSGILSNDNPQALQMKVYYEVSLHFGRRAREGLHQLKQGHIVFRQDDEGVEYATLAFNPLEKNHQGLSQGTKEHSQRMYGTGTDLCPLKSLKLYLDRLAPSNESFFQTPKKKNYRLAKTWYTRSSVGINTIGKFMGTISADAKLSKPYTNHCVRATCVNTLREQGIPSRDIRAVTGHKSEQSIEYYSKTPDKVRKHMSDVLAGKAPSCSQTSTVEVNKVVTVKSTPVSANVFSNVTFNNCNVTVNYK